jgi:histidyl-tRNA synthetase
MGIERMILLLKNAQAQAAAAPLAFVVHAGATAAPLARRVAEMLRDAGHAIVLNAGGGSFKSQMKKADASGARFALLVGDDEASRGVVGVKPLRDAGEQLTLSPRELAPWLAAHAHD